MRTGLAGRRKWVALGAAVVVAAGAVGIWALVRPDPSQATPTTIVATATVGTVRQTVSTTGTLAPARQANLSFTVSGTVTSVPVSVGEHVGVGSTLATLNADDLRTSVDLAQASVVAAQAQVTSAATSSAAQQASASAQLAAANSSLAQAKANLAAATLTSPITGTVAEVNLTPGDTVGSGSSSGSGSGSGSAGGGSGSGSVGGNGSGSNGGSGNGSGSSASSGSSSAEVVVISNGAWIVNASVGAADLAQVHKGLQVQITPDGTAQQVFGTVSTVGVMATSTSGTAAFPVTIKVTGSPTGLYAGGTVSAQIVVKQLDNVLTVPTAAVSADTSGTYVMVSKSGKQVRTPVVIGAVFGGQTQITSGISEGAQVVVRQLRLPAGGTVGTNQRQRGQFGGGGFGGGGFNGGAGTGGAVNGQ